MRDPQSILDDLRTWLTGQHVDVPQMPLERIPRDCLEALDHIMDTIDATPVETACDMLRKLEKEIIPTFTSGDSGRTTRAREQVKAIFDMAEKVKLAKFGPASESKN